VDKDTFARLEAALDPFLESFAGCAVAPTRRLIGTYIRGQLSSLPRKSVKPMALHADIPPRTLQELLSLHRWDEELLIALLQRRVRRAHPGSQAFGLVFESRCVKKGDRTPGVARQTCESAGRPRNCVVMQHLAFSDGDFHCLLDSAIYLPESWTGDFRRREAAGIPGELRYRSKIQIVADQLRRAEANGLELRRLVIPAEGLVDEAFLEMLKGGGRSFAAWPTLLEPDPRASSAVGLTEEARRGLLRSGAEARRVIEARMREIGLDHFEVRTFRSLSRHLALSAVSLLFLAEQGEPPRRERGPLPLRSHA
jgi:SRSO17 transposase